MTSNINDSELLRIGLNVVRIEAEAVASLAGRIDASFMAACRLMQDCPGRIVVTGMGKSGHVGGKIAATLASTGTPAFFVHPGEASHGDLGMITSKDVVIALSNSGETRNIDDSARHQTHGGRFGRHDRKPRLHAGTPG